MKRGQSVDTARELMFCRAIINKGSAGRQMIPQTRKDASKAVLESYLKVKSVQVPNNENSKEHVVVLKRFYTEVS